MNRLTNLALVAAVVLVGAAAVVTARGQGWTAGDPVGGVPLDTVVLPALLKDRDWDADTKSAPTNQYTLEVVGQVGASVRSLQLEGGVLFAAGGSRLVAYDLTDPALPAEIGSLEGPYEIREIAVAGTTAYAIDAADRLRVVDVAYPESMNEKSETELSLGAVRDAVVSAGTLFLAESWAAEGVPSGLRAIDVQDPLSPTEVDLYAFSDIDGRALAIDGTTVFLATSSPEGSGGLYIFDFSATSDIEMVSSHAADGAATGVALDGPRAYINVNPRPLGLAEMQVVDIGDALEPYGLGKYEFPDTSSTITDEGYLAREETPWLHKLAASGSDVFTLERHYGVSPGESEPRFRSFLRLIDASDAASPAYVTGIELPVEYPADLVANEGYVYVAGGQTGITVVHVVD